MSDLDSKIAKIVALHGADLYDTEIANENDNTIFRVYITKKDGKVDLDLCADISNDLSPMLDIEPPVSGAYYLEVSSPGIERSLKKPSHYKSAVGEKAKFKLYGNEKVKGEIISANDESVTITNRDGEREIPYTDIRKAKTYFEW